jgi:Sporulation and spore germination
MRVTPLTRGAVALIVAAGAAGCGVPDDSQPRAISAADAPIDLGVTTTTSTPATGTDALEVWLIDGEGRLRPVDRSVPSPASVQAAVETLLAAPNEDEDTLYDTAIPEGTTLPATIGEDGVAVVQLGPDGTGLLAIQGTGQLDAFAQVVLTASEVEDVTGVRFVQDDGTGNLVPFTQTPTDEGNVDRPVTADDYVSLRR